LSLPLRGVCQRNAGLWYNFGMEPFHSDHSRLDERKLYDRTGDEITLDEVERIAI
jgi:hypothetical protein